MESIIMLSVVCAAIAVIPAGVLEWRRKKHNVGTLPYAWGYFQGVAWSLFGWALLAVGAASGVGDSSLLWFLALLYGLSGWFVIRRNRWGWVVLTVGSMNPFLWVANGVYVRNRWKELGGSAQPVSPATSQTVASNRSAPVGVPVGNESSARIGHLERLVLLRENGLLSDEEFSVQKTKLLGNEHA